MKKKDNEFITFELYWCEQDKLAVERLEPGAKEKCPVCDKELVSIGSTNKKDKQ